MDRRGIGDAPTREERRDSVGDEGFTDPAEAEAGKRDAELGGGERGGEAVEGHEGELHAPAAGIGEGAELAGADLDEGEFGGDEEPVGKDEGEEDEGLERCAEECTHGSRGRSGAGGAGQLWILGARCPVGGRPDECGSLGEASLPREEEARASAARETRPMASVRA